MASEPERELAFQLQHGTKRRLLIEAQHKFHPDREWRADFAVWPSLDEREKPLLVEIEGAVRGLPGRHQRIDGMTEDCEKYAAAMLLGMPVLRVMPSQVKSGYALLWIEQLLGLNWWNETDGAG